MTDTATASSVMSDIRLHTDTVNDANITDAFLLSIVDKSYSKLYKNIATQYQGFFDLEHTSITLVPGTRTYALPADFMHLRGVDIMFGTDRVKMRRIAFGERDRWTDDPRFVPFRMERARTYYGYLTQKDNLRIEPLPNSSENLLLTYVPRPTRITTVGQTFDVIAGFEDFIVYDSSIMVLAKQERDPMMMTQLRADALKTIIDVVSPRETGEPIQVRDDYFGQGGY